MQGTSVGIGCGEACREVLGLSEFDEDVFAKTVEKILTTDTDSLVFHFMMAR